MCGGYHLDIKWSLNDGLDMKTWLTCQENLDSAGVCTASSDGTGYDTGEHKLKGRMQKHLPDWDCCKSLNQE